MSSGGAEALKAAIRRSLVLIVALALLGVVAVNVFQQVRGPRYEADSRVLISTTPISRIITGTEPAFVDPQRSQETARSLAQSPQVYELAAERTGGSLGSASELQASVTVSAGDSDLVTFTASSSDPDRAVAIANAAANAYVVWRAELSGEPIAKSIQQLNAKLSSLAAGDPQASDLREQLNRLELLQTLNASDAVVVEEANSAVKTSPSPLRDSLLGLAIGLVVALLVVAVREAVDTTVRSESDVEDLLAAPVLASVRTLPRRTQMVTFGRHAATFGDTYALLAAHVGQLRDGRERLAVAITSSVSGEGKTTTAGNLAVALARRGIDVVLADLDSRKPAIAKLFRIPPEAPGVLQVLDGSKQLDDVLWSVDLGGPQPRISQNGSRPVESVAGTETSPAAGSLVVLPSGGSVRTQAVAHSPNLHSLLEDLRDRADVVLIDTPPALLTVEMAELSRVIDCVLVVVRQGHVTQRSLRTLGRQARSWPAELVGAVVTDVPGDDQYGY